MSLFSAKEKASVAEGDPDGLPLVATFEPLVRARETVARVEKQFSVARVQHAAAVKALGDLKQSAPDRMLAGDSEITKQLAAARQAAAQAADALDVVQSMVASASEAAAQAQADYIEELDAAALRRIHALRAELVPVLKAAIALNAAINRVTLRAGAMGAGPRVRRSTPCYVGLTEDGLQYWWQNMLPPPTDQDAAPRKIDQARARAAGTVKVRFLSSVRVPGWDSVFGTYFRAGEVATFPFTRAAKIVADGFAEWTI